MATYKEKLAVESVRGTIAEQRQIHFFEEDGFWRACQWSAWLYNNACTKEQKLNTNKWYIKNVDSEVISIAFPTTSLDKYLLQGVQPVEEGVGRMRMDLPLTMCNETPESEWEKRYNEWFQSIPVSEDNRKKEKNKTAGGNQSLIGEVLNQRPVKLADIMSSIMAYSIEQHSPIEAMMFLSQIKQQLANL